MNPARISEHLAWSAWGGIYYPDLLPVARTAEALMARFALAGIFFLSGRTKVEGWLSVTEGAYTLFAEEYKVPLLPPEFAAHMAVYAEHLFPLLLILGLGTRFSALALLGMTAVIQVFVYPGAWPTHLSWRALRCI